MFLEIGADPTKNEGDIAAMLRQFAFREMTIIKTRERGMNMENTIDEWINVFIDPKSLANLKSRVNEASTMTYDKLITAKTGIPFLDKVIGYSLHKGVMPNRARMWFAGKIFYEAPSGIDAINWLIRFFNEVTLDGQCPTTYTQCCDAMGLQYGKVMLLNETRVKMLLDLPK
jgi:deoxyribodipyrimidine photolyase